MSRLTVEAPGFSPANREFENYGFSRGEPG